MRIININKLTKIKKSERPLVIGYFSCIHVMHNELLNLYHEFNLLTFKDTAFKQDTQIYSYKDRMNNLDHFPIINCYVYDIDKANITAERFIQLFLKKIKPSIIVVGSDFKFGCDQKGISELRHHFNVEMVNYHSEVSTTIISNMLKDGKVEDANDFLLTPYYYVGKWISGKKNGRTIGYRTINIKVDKPLLIPEGSYAVNLKIGKKVYRAIAFYGASQTFGVNKVGLEVYVIGKNIFPKTFYPLSICDIQSLQTWYTPQTESSCIDPWIPLPHSQISRTCLQECSPRTCVFQSYDHAANR